MGIKIGSRIEVVGNCAHPFRGEYTITDADGTFTYPFFGAKKDDPDFTLWFDPTGQPACTVNAEVAILEK